MLIVYLCVILILLIIQNPTLLFLDLLFHAVITNPEKTIEMRLIHSLSTVNPHGVNERFLFPLVMLHFLISHLLFIITFCHALFYRFPFSHWSPLYFLSHIYPFFFPFFSRITPTKD